MTERPNGRRDVSAELLKPLTEIFGLLGKSLAETTTERMAGLLPDFEAQGKKTSYELEAIKDQIGAFAVSAEMLENANRANQLLGDQFYERRIIGPMARGLFPIMDLIRDAIDRPDSDRQCLSALRAQLEQFLTGYGIEAFSCKASSPFDPKNMKVLQNAPTKRPDLNGLVAKSLQCGFRMNERVLRLQTVSIYKFEEFEELETPSTSAMSSADKEGSNHDHTRN